MKPKTESGHPGRSKNGSTMSHRVVLLYGPGTGLGKSTIATALARRLTDGGVQVRLIREEEVMDLTAFHKYVRQVKQGHAQDTEALLESCQTFIHELEKGLPEVAVVDSLLPCWDWISTAGCSDTIIAAFTETLSEFLRPLNPLLILLVGDLGIGLDRAVKDRGAEWALSLAAERTGVRDIEALRKYLETIRGTAERMLIHWRYDLVQVDSTKYDAKSSVDQVVSVFRA
jgi:DNA polymerase III delta prime subunit